MHVRGVDLERGVLRGSAEEHGRSAGAQAQNGLFPHVRQTDGLNGDVGAAFAGRQRPDRRRAFLGRLQTGQVDDGGGPRGLGLGEAALRAVGHDDRRSAQLRQPQVHLADRARAVDHDGVSERDSRFVHPVDHGGQGLERGRGLEGQGVGDRVRVALDDRARDDDLLGEGAVEILEVLAQRLAPDGARPAVAARSGVGGDDPLADLEVGHAFAHLADDPGELVAEAGGQRGKQGGVPPPVGFQVRSARGGGLDVHGDLTGAGVLDGDVLQAQIAGAVEHVSLHDWFLSRGRAKARSTVTAGLPRNSARARSCRRWHGVTGPHSS